MEEQKPPQPGIKRVRTLLWLLVGAAVLALVAVFAIQHSVAPKGSMGLQPAESSIGGPFTLTGGDGKPFSSSRLAGKPYAIFFGFTRCGDVCPVTLGRLIKLRRQAGSDDALNIVFVTIDPKNDGPEEVGQYAGLFGAPIIGLTGPEAQIAQVKRQYGIYAEPNPQSTGHGDMMNHTSSVLLFDGNGRLAGTISGSEPDASALQKLKALIG
jgi:protein SCO1/2